MKAHWEEELASALPEAAAYVHRVNHMNGWFDGTRTFGEDVALLHSEVSELLEEHRNHRDEAGYSVTTPDRALTERQLELLDKTHDGKPVSPAEWTNAGFEVKLTGVPFELADIFIRLLDVCHRYDVNLADVFTKKMQANEVRGYRHGGKRL